MHQPNEPRKYQLFPGVEKLSLNVARLQDSDALPIMGATIAASEKILPLGNSSRRPKEQSLVRRRKVSVPELGPMTTVQEVAMDSRMLDNPLEPFLSS
jgi:hypothetical protein